MSGVAAAGIGLQWPSKLPPNTTTYPHKSHFFISTNFTSPSRTHQIIRHHNHRAISPLHEQFASSTSSGDTFGISALLERAVLIDLDPATAKLAIGLLGPFLSAFGFLFIVRIVMSWYPNLPVGKFPYVVAYAPTEPLLVQTRKVIKPLGGVDVTPVVWFALISFANEILVGPQGLLVLLSQQKV